MKSLVRLTNVGGDVFLVEELQRRVDPGFGGGFVPTDPGYGQGHPGYRPDQDLPWGPGHPSGGFPISPGHPGNALPIKPVRPEKPIVLPPIGMWPPTLPPGIDNSLPPGHQRPDQPIVIPPDPDLGIEQPIVLPVLPAGTALIIALTGSNVNVPTPQGVPPGHKPAILYQGAGTKPVLVYVTAAPPTAAPK